MMRRILQVLRFTRLRSMSCVALLTVALPALRCHAAELLLTVVHQSDVMMQARDGVALACDIYRPARGATPLAEPLPVLLQRTPYDKAAAAAVAIAEQLARSGYIVVLQDIRGRHHSEGQFSKYDARDAADGYDTVEWAAHLPGANGKVGMYGTSYAAHTQADAAKLHPPHLATLVINMGGMSNAWDHSVRNDGAFEVGRQLSWAWEQIIEDSKDPVGTLMAAAGEADRLVCRAAVA